MRFSKSLLLALLPATMWLFFNASVNRHIHMLSNGYMITHAHPFHNIPSNSDPGNSHHHSRKELILLSLISNITTTLLLFLLFRPLLKTLPQMVRFFTNHVQPTRKYYQVYHYHGPPVQ